MFVTSRSLTPPRILSRLKNLLFFYLLFILLIYINILNKLLSPSLQILSIILWLLGFNRFHISLTNLLLSPRVVALNNLKFSQILSSHSRIRFQKKIQSYWAPAWFQILLIKSKTIRSGMLIVLKINQFNWILNPLIDVQ